MTRQISSAEAKEQGMPDIPDGWHYELSAYDLNVMHVVWPDHGAASVHFKHRTVASGWCVPRAMPKELMPTGKGWRAALVVKAVALLKSAWE